ncbi:MAG TPA: hypothetical protein VGP97_20835 [Burkholderiales bacterium]|jgi:hypothetical protein|nr:hypothetical protein [Burkholderiales bacterium]
MAIILEVSKMRRILGALCAGAFLIAAVFLIGTVSALAQSTGIYPQRAVRIVVPYPPGSGTDIVARLLGQRSHHRLALCLWGQRFRPSATFSASASSTAQGAAG